MFLSYIKIALRAMAKNRLFAAINVLGLAVGLCVYLFAGVVAQYEEDHDLMFANHERIYTLGSVLSPQSGMSVKEFDNTYMIMAPLIEAELPELEYIARAKHGEFLISIGDKHFYERPKFVDPNFLNIFDFNFIHGDKTALTNPQGVLLSEKTALKLFGRTDVVGETLLMNHENSFHVVAVIEEVPANSHFHSTMSSLGLNIVGTIKAYSDMTGWDIGGNWNNISGGDQTYIMTKEPMDLAVLNEKVNAIYDRHVDPEMKQTFMSGVKPRLLHKTNTAIWDMVGMPAIETVQILGVLILIIAIVNYTNLAIAQSMGRAREVGLRKTMGATRGQLMLQFLTESITTVFLSVIIAMVFLELVVPPFNAVMEKVVTINYLTMLPWLIATTLVVGVVSGAYPSYLITKISPIDALKNSPSKGGKGSLFRATMIGIQFMLSIFMLAIVMIVFLQNQKVQESSEIYPKDQVLVLEKMYNDTLTERNEVLRNELHALPFVSNVTFAMQVPFEQSNSTTSVSVIKGDEQNKVSINQNNVDVEFLKTFDIPLIAGRDFSTDISADIRSDLEVRYANVIVNEMLARKLGFENAADIVGQTFWGMPGEREPFQYNVIGVMADQNFLGLHNSIKPFVFAINPGSKRFGAIRIQQGAPADALEQVEAVWKRVNPDYPINHRYLSGLFESVYEMYRAMNNILAGFALLALSLALIGLFGLAAFMAKSRTREIGIRKVLGASTPQIIRLLLWQFSRPVMWAIIFALPLSFFAANMYLQFFAERIDYQIPVILISGVVAVLLACGVIAVHAIKVARANPIVALRYE